MMEFSGITQFGSKDFRRAVSKLKGVHAKSHDGEWRWNINPDAIDYDEIERKLGGFSQDDIAHFKALVAALNRKQATEGHQKDVSEDTPAYDSNPSSASTSCCSFAEFIDELSKKNKKDMTSYTVIGDIINGYQCSEDTLLFDFLDNHNERQSIKLFVNKHTKGKALDLEALNDTRVKVSGKVNFSVKYMSMNILADKIDILGVCSREEEYEHYAEECTSYFHTDEEQKHFTIPDLTDIGLIPGPLTGKTIQGVSDFVKSIPKALREHIHAADAVISDIPSIISALDKLNQEGKCQVIAIVRGGGSSESMARYSDSRLVKAIYESRIPVITGIGHQSDHLLCEQAACRNCGTPTGAGDFLRRQYYRQSYKKLDRQREHYNAKTEFDRILASANKEELLLENEDLKEELKSLQQENELLSNKLDDMKHRGLLKRIFNIG